MGVTHLWKILQPVERPVSTLSEFRGTIVAVDISIWIHHLLHGQRDGDVLPHAYLIGIFHRICTLLYHGIKPIFVFDGAAPSLKKRTLVCCCVCLAQATDKSTEATGRESRASQRGQAPVTHTAHDKLAARKARCSDEEKINSV